MDIQQFNLLENKVIQALDLIASLKTENQELKEALAEHDKKLQAKDEELELLQSQLKDSELHLADTQHFKKREAEIRQRVEKMLNKLESLEFRL